MYIAIKKTILELGILTVKDQIKRDDQFLENTFAKELLKTA